SLVFLHFNLSSSLFSLGPSAIINNLLGLTFLTCSKTFLVFSGLLKTSIAIAVFTLYSCILFILSTHLQIVFSISQYFHLEVKYLLLTLCLSFPLIYLYF